MMVFLYSGVWCGLIPRCVFFQVTFSGMAVFAAHIPLLLICLNSKQGVARLKAWCTKEKSGLERKDLIGEELEMIPEMQRRVILVQICAIEDLSKETWHWH